MSDKVGGMDKVSNLNIREETSARISTAKIHRKLQIKKSRIQNQQGPSEEKKPEKLSEGIEERFENIEEYLQIKSAKIGIDCQSLFF
jgi:hypothetical protein